PPWPSRRMRAMVTGAGGFVGANLVRVLLARGDQPEAIVRPGGDIWRLDEVRGELPLIEVDLGDADAFAAAVVERRPEVLFHLAAFGAYSWQQDLDAMLSVNVRATEILLGAAREVGARVVHAGSSSEYGQRDRAPSELDRLEPNSHYAVTKAAATHLCRLAAATHGQVAVTLRLYSIYGPWEDPRRLMPTLVRAASRGHWPPLVSPDTVRDFVWVGDACDAFIRAATVDFEEPGVMLNIASGAQTSLRALVDTARRVFKVEEPPQWRTMNARPWDTDVWFGDPTEAARTLGWRARTPLDEGLQAMAAWLEERPQLLERYRPPLPTP
ncbi:MAG: NAD-dependent epimerase/dehydratase family protein, partial [Chloroflexi bacterium]|nr:NAD-dependent epimerase/dehydratase family protein [Chloroflexota bacterium]